MNNDFYGSNLQPFESFESFEAFGLKNNPFLTFAPWKKQSPYILWDAS
jgi:hypothetical protein